MPPVVLNVSKKIDTMFNHSTAVNPLKSCLPRVLLPRDGLSANLVVLTVSSANCSTGSRAVHHSQFSSTSKGAFRAASSLKALSCHNHSRESFWFCAFFGMRQGFAGVSALAFMPSLHLAGAVCGSNLATRRYRLAGRYFGHSSQMGATVVGVAARMVRSAWIAPPSSCSPSCTSMPGASSERSLFRWRRRSFLKSEKPHPLLLL